MNLSNQEKVTIITLLFFIISGLGIILYRDYTANKSIEIIAENESIEQNETQVIEKSPVIIHIVGAIKNPGVYQLEEKDRVIDAIKMAGGEAEEANLDAINLAAFIYDGQRIIIPFLQAEENEPQNKNINFSCQESYELNNLPITTSQKININTAEAKKLECLPGIGPVLSKRIVSFRNKNGFFETIDCIKEVSGIGDKKFEGIEDLICVH